MSYTIEIERDGRGVVVTFTGEVSGKEAIEANGAMYEKDPNGKFEYQIWDHSNVTGFDVSPDELRSIVLQDYSASTVNPEQIVAVVGRPEILEGLDDVYRMFAGVWTQFESRTFDTMSEARDWVDSRVGR